jgi:1-deoxy-D-xylulose-5-phosphate synthase
MAGMLTNNPTNDKIITLIGDSSITNGVALEGLNYIGEKGDKRAIIILNDNKMGISKSVGAFSKMFSRMRGTTFYRGLKAFLIHVLPKFLVRGFHRIKRSLKALILRDNVFEDMGFDYYGPYDGNNVKTLVKLFERIKTHTESPVVLHLNTIKGKGYKISEDDMEGNFHGVSPFDPKTGEPLKKCEGISYSEAVSNYLIEKRKNNEFVVITPAMISGAKLHKFQELYPKDIIDVGIAEEHATVMSAGVALNNKKVVLLMYSTFAQRAFDELLNDIARQDLPVIIGIDRAGIVGEDGVTHQGIYDVAMFSLMPNVIVTMPRNEQELVGLFNYAFESKHPIVIRYPRISECIKDIDYKYVSSLD